MSHHDAVASVFASINVGEPTAAAGWSLFPLFPTVPPTVSLLTVRAASERGLARIEELPGGASVRALFLHNEATLPVLVSDGDLFVAGRQDRIADRPMVVGAGVKREVPVSCVEQGRWATRDRDDFRVHADSADLRVRHRRMTDPADSARPDQNRTWQAVAEHRTARGHHDRTGSLVASQAQPEARVEALVAALPYVYGAAGLALCHDTAAGPRVALLCWCVDPAVTADAWTGLVRTTLSSLPAGTKTPKLSRTELRSLMARLARSPKRVTDDDDTGTVLAFASGKTAGRLLVHNGRPVQLVALRA